MPSAETIRTVAVATVVVLSTFVGLLVVPGPAAAAGALPISEGFDTNSPTDWEFYGTAASNVQVGPSDEEAALQLTSASNDLAGTGLYNRSFSSGNGITTEFRYYAAEGTGADGFTFFLLDDSDLSGFSGSDIGDAGGALGYGDDGSGAITGGFIGVGFDEYGNFDEPSYTGSPGGEQEITIRGSTDATEAPVVANTSVSPNTVDGGWRTARITVDPTAGTTDEVEISVYVDFDEDGTYTEVFAPTTYDLATDIEEESGRMPADFKLGFSGSTGGSTNVHAVDALSVTEPVDLTTTVTSQPPNASYYAGETVEYTFDVTNNGPNDDGSVTLSPSVATDATGLRNVDWDKGADGSFDVTDAGSITVGLRSGETASVTLRGTVGDDAARNLDHDIAATPSSSYTDPSPDDAKGSVSVDLNEPPSFTGNEELATIDEDPATNGGNRIDGIEAFGGEFSDADGDGFGGIVVTDDAATSGAGTWQYSTDGGTNWHAVDDGTLAASNGLLLNASDRLRFDPAADYYGTPGDLTVFAVDDSKSTSYTSGSTRLTHDTTTDSKSSVVATSGATLGITVDPVNDAPVASAASNVTNLALGNSVAFDATGSSDVDGDTLTYDWDTDGDGTDDYTDAPTPTHQYTKTGTYTARLTVDDGTTTTTDTLTITVTDTTPPTSDASNSAVSGDEDTAIAFDGTASSDNVDIASYEWDWTSDGSYDDTGKTATHTYADPGSYTVTLRVTDAGGNTDTDTLTVDVSSTHSRSGGSSDTTVTEIRWGSDGATFRITNVESDDPIDVSVDGVGTDVVDVETVTADVDQDTNAGTEMQVRGTSDPPSGVDAYDGAVLAYVTVDLDDPIADRVTRGTITFRVAPAVMPAAPATMSTYRFHDGEWQAVETSYEGNRRFSVVTPGYSTFAIVVGDRSGSASTPTPPGTATGTPTPPGTATGTPTPLSVSPTSSATADSSTQTPGSPTGTEAPGFGFVTVSIALLTVALRLRETSR